jgi:hypothetical protein
MRGALNIDTVTESQVTDSQEVNSRKTTLFYFLLLARIKSFSYLVVIRS